MPSKRFPYLLMIICLACAALWLGKDSFQASKTKSKLPMAKQIITNESSLRAALKQPAPAASIVWPESPAVAQPVAAPSVQSLREFQFAPHEEKFAAFNTWAADFLSGTKPAPEMIAEGVKLAERRRDEMTDLIQADPQRAIELTFPRALRNSLPAEITSLLETPFSARGDLTVRAALPAPGEQVRTVERQLILGEQTYDAYVYGRRLGEPTKFNTPVYGITVGKFAAVAEDPVRSMSIDEAAFHRAQGTFGTMVCEFLETKPAAATQVAAMVETEGKVYALCCQNHGQNLSATFQALGETPEQTASILPGETAESPYTEGTKTLVIIRIDFDDMSGDPFSLNTATNMVNGLNTFFRTMSYNKTGFSGLGKGSVITPTFRMPQTAAYYGANDAAILRRDARDAATAAGYNLNSYHFDLVCFGNVPGFTFAGLGYVGAPGSWIRGNSDVGVVAHELGHNLGLNHANYWDTGGQSIMGSGSTVEYGDKFDTMGNAAAGGKHFNARYKSYLNWLTSADIKSHTTNGTYRIAPHDRSNATGVRALRISKNSSTNYWVEFRANYGANKWLTNGVSIRWAGNQNESSLLLDTTPGSSDGLDDAALMIGKTYSDKISRIHITPVAKGPNNAYMDVVVNKGAFATNLPPIATMITDRTNATINGTIRFDVDAIDPNGDPLAYFWEFGDGTFTSNAPSTTHRWTSAGEYVVQCYVSDMKGGLSSKSQVIRIGSPSTYRIAGRIMNGDAPLSGATVTAGAKYAVSDSDGRYYITGLPAGSYTLKAAMEGFLFSRSGFSNPVAVAPSRDSADFYAIPASAQNLATLVAAGGAWRYSDTGVSLGTVWRGVTYNDATWKSGVAPLGYGDNERTEISFGGDPAAKHVTTYFRRKFVVQNKQDYAGLTLGFRRDDGGVVYLNNREVFRSNMPSGAISSSTLAVSAPGGAE
ncbi:MAG: PKD domain-containing protein, partial [Verrucomicrobiales bacterium]